MRCAACSHDAKKKERENGRCPACNAVFVFDPTAGDPFTDVAFSKAIDRVSGDGQVRWTTHHLYFELARRRSGISLTVAVVVGSILLAAGLVAATLVLCPPLGVIPAAIWGWWWVRSDRDRTGRFPRELFETQWRRWSLVKGTPAHLITPLRRQITRRSKAEEDELLSYSFDRAVIADNPATVDTLIANNFHFENNCAVLSIGGYPQEAFETVRRMIRNNPRIIVLAVHHASPEGCRLARQLATDPEWFGGRGVRVLDVGLRPAHARLFKGLTEPNEGDAVRAGAGIDAGEAAWLSKRRLSLHAVRPEQLVKRLFRGLTIAEGGGGGGGDGGGGGGDSTVDIMGSDADVSDGGGDSFG